MTAAKSDSDALPRRPRGRFLVPRIASGVRVLDGDPPSVEFADGRDVLELGEAAVAVVSFVDGVAHHIEIARRIADADLQPSDPEVVGTALLILAARGVIELDHRQMPFESYGTPLSGCLACGRSCEGWSVGHIPDHEAERIEKMHAELAEQHPRVAAYPPFSMEKEGDDDVRYLSFPGKRCIFLDDANLCLLHGNYGSESKPLICQQFPIVATEADDEVRIGLRPHCFRLHKTFESGEPIDPRAAARQVDGRREPVMMVDHRRATRGLRDEMYRQELDVLRWLREPDMTLVEFTHRLAGSAPSDGPRVTLPTAAIVAVVPRLTALRDKYNRKYYLDHDTLVGASMRDLLTAFFQLNAEELPRDLRLPRRCWRYVAFAMGQKMYLRSNTKFPSVRVSALCMVVGALGVSWTLRETLSTMADEDEIPDAFGERFAAWFRVFSEMAVLDLFPAHEDFEAFLEALPT